MPDPYLLRIDSSRLRILVERTRGPFGGPEIREAAARGVRRWGLLVQTRVVRNVTGYPVVYDGQVFRVMVRTGTLRGAIELQWPYGTQYQARVFVNGANTNPGSQQGGRSRPTPVSAYAASIEFGHKEIDLKRTMLGKTVPFFGARAEKARGPYAARGLKPIMEHSTDYGSQWRSQAHDAKLAAKGKGPMLFEKKGGNAAYQGAKRGASTYFISFRKVGREGWIIPEAKPRPFLRAALEGTMDEGRLMMIREVRGALQA